MLVTICHAFLRTGSNYDSHRLSLTSDSHMQVLRGCILMELSFRSRVKTVLEIRKRPYADRLLEVTDKRATGEVLLDEALKLIAVDQQSIANWIDLLSGETWNLMKIGYQLKQVRERIQKGLVDKGVLRTEKRNFVLFDMPTHPVSDHSVKEEIIRRTVDCLMGRGPAPDRRTVAMVCAAYAANVLENALVKLSHQQREACFRKADEMLQEYASMSAKAQQGGCTEVMAGVLSVYTKMDSIL
ncbi:Golgi phosphoprotein 3 [Gaertneriomyces semiglobifer]|nr:Golgi phosphoprotein 3 [Gaertneriomyces semiglobifer]